MIMNQRLPLILSCTALVVALVGSTPLGRAAESALDQVVPRAKKADFAANAGKLNGHRSSLSPRRGQIPVVGDDGKLPASLGAVGPQGPAGEKGEPGPAGASGYQQLENQISIAAGEGYRAYQMQCPGDKSVLGGGHLIREDDSDHLRLVESRPTSKSVWRFKFQNFTGNNVSTQYVYAICANMGS
jgi:hypothetical protein